MGWEPAEVTTFEYDEAGRIVRMITVREPEFTPGETAMLLASRELEFEPKNSLGIPLSESMDPKNQFSFMPPEGPSVDWAEAALGKKQDAFYDAPEWKDKPRHGHRWRAPTLRRS